MPEYLKRLETLTWLDNAYGFVLKSKFQLHCFELMKLTSMERLARPGNWLLSVFDNISYEVSMYHPKQHGNGYLTFRLSVVLNR